MSLLKYVVQGGPVMIILLGCSVFALAIALLKGYQFYKLRIRRINFVEGVMKALKANDLNAALTLLKNNTNPVARVMEAGVKGCITCGPNESCLKAEISRIGSNEIRDLESWLKPLSSIGHLAPLLGLLGTVLGMITAFMELEGATSQISPALLAGGIWEALLTTAFGLSIAIPVMAIYTFLEGEVDRIRAAMEDATTRVLVHFNIEAGFPERQHRVETVIIDEPFAAYGV